jgi:DNA polymerase III alpha subunit (gram-positive type)
MYILGLDLETTGTDPNKDQITEVGAVIWDVTAKKPVKFLSEIVKGADLPLSDEVVEITGITDADINDWGKDLEPVLSELCEMAAQCEFIVAHNGRAFDKVVLDRHLMQFEGLGIAKPWIDTMTDVPYPGTMKTRKLSYLAAEHGFLNPFSHRAVFDVLSMMKVLSFYDIQDVVALQQSPLVRVVAEVTYEQRDKARLSGFRWDRNSKQWFIEVKQMQLEEMSFPFEISMEHL